MGGTETEEIIQWPWQYDFPPFFTIQPNLETRKKQLEAWRNVILQFCRTTKLQIIDVGDCNKLPLFNNTKISRTLSSDDVILVLDYLAKYGNSEPVDRTKKRWYIYWHTVDEWADLIYSWVQQNGLNNTVCTLFEITNASNQEFNGLLDEVILKILKVLESRNKAEVITMDDGCGVKFF